MRFSRAGVDRSLHENLWARFGWTAARHADGYVVASAASINAMPQPMEAIRDIAVASGSGEQHLEFTADQGTRATSRRTSLPAHTLPYTVSFWRRAGDADRLALGWAQARPDRVRRTTWLHVVAVAFYPLELDELDGAQPHVYVMSVWTWDEERNERILVRDLDWYDEEDPRNAVLCLRFSRAEVDRSLDENLWARFAWTAARHADGYVVASAASINAIHNPNAACQEARAASDVSDVSDVSSDSDISWELLMFEARLEDVRQGLQQLEELARQREQELPAAGIKTKVFTRFKGMGGLVGGGMGGWSVCEAWVRDEVRGD